MKFWSRQLASTREKAEEALLTDIDKEAYERGFKDGYGKGFKEAASVSSGPAAKEKQTTSNEGVVECGGGKSEGAVEGR